MIRIWLAHPWLRTACVLSSLAAAMLLAVQAGALADTIASTAYVDGAFVGPSSSDPSLAQVVLTFPSPAQYSMGLAWDGTSLWLCDGSFAGMIYRLSPVDGAVLGAYDIGVHKLRGLTMGNGYLWTSSWDTGRIYKLNPATGHIVASYAAPFSGKPDGLAWEGGELWIAEEGKDDIGRIYHGDPATGAALRWITPPAGCCFNPRGLAWDGTYLWVGYQSGVGQIYRIDPASGFGLESFDAPSGPYQQGLTFDGQFLWSTGGDNIVYKIDVGAPALSIEGTPWAEVKAGYRP